MIKFYIDNKKGRIWDVSNIVTDITWKTSRTGKPATLDFSIVSDGVYQWKDFDIQNGYIVRFSHNENNLFYGYIFTVSTGTDLLIKVTAYDQIRYLLNNDTFIFTDVTADQVISRIAKLNGFKVGFLTKGIYKIPSMVEDNQKLLDMIMKAIDQTLSYKKQLLVFYDDFGELTLRESSLTTPPVMIGKKHHLFDYSVKRSIDSDTYNLVKMYQDNKESGERKHFVYKDSVNIKNWGILQKYEQAQTGWNEAQINQYAQTRLQSYSHEQITMSIESIGDNKIRAGKYIYILLDEFKTQVYLVEECSHKFSGGEHTMSLDVKVV